MFKPVCSEFIRSVKQSGGVNFVEDPSHGRDVYNIMLLSNVSDRPPKELGRCLVQIKATTLYFEHIILDAVKEFPTQTMYMFFIMAIDKAIEIAKEYNKKNLIMTTDIDFAAEVFADFGFKLYSAGAVNSDTFLAIKKLDTDIRTDYSIRSLQALKKRIPSAQIRIPWFFLGNE